MNWLIETIDRDGNMYVWYRHGTLEEVEEQMWLDNPDHVVVDCIPQIRDEPANKELNFDLD